MSEKSVAQQLTTAVHLAEANQLINPEVRIHCEEDAPDVYVHKPLPVNDSGSLRGLEVWIVDHNGTVKGVVGDHADGRTNIVLAVP